MMASVDNSNHMCLICNQAVTGLQNYVRHFQTHATPKESHIVEQKYIANDVKNEHVSGSQGDGASSRSRSLHSDYQQQQSSENVVDIDTYSGDTSPMSEFIDNTDEFNDPDIGTDALLSPKHCSDFFQSLELKSANEDNPPRPKIKAVQRLSILEDDAHAESLLPITSILCNLEFSSDDDFIGVSDNEGEVGQDENFWVSDDDEYDDDHSSTHPPQGHTGGKWKPGEGPKPHLSVTGNLKSGYRPGPACRKNILKRPGKSRGSKNDVGKTFYCNVCLSYFADRNAYSLHFSQSQHKKIAEAKKQEKMTTDYLEESQVHENSSQHLSPEEGCLLKPRRENDGCHCPVCNLYFDNAVVFSTHCETKLHKDAMLKRGFREYKGSDGIIIRIDVHNETIYKDKQENVWSAINNCRPVQISEQKVKEPEDHSCHICQKHFTRKYEMARHLLTRMHRARALKHPEAESVEMLNKYNKYMIRLSPFQCGICQYYFNRQRDFLDHMGSSGHVVTCEDMLGAITCAACRYKTHKHNEMMQHLQYPEHLAAVEKRHGVCIVRESHTRITCKFCGVRMHSAVRMKRHCQKRHRDRLSEVQVTMDIKPVEYNMYKCPLCEKTFRAKSLLQLHFLKVHKNTSLFNCLECNRGFLDQRRLDNHLRTRFHAKHVVANKIKGAQFSKVAALKKAAVMNGLKKRGRGRPKKDENLKTAASRMKVSTPAPDISKPTSKDADKEKSKDPKSETAVVPRRSNRKRKTITFFSDEEPVKNNQVKEKINGTAGAARLLRRNIKITQDKINKLLKEKSEKSGRVSRKKISKQSHDNKDKNNGQSEIEIEVSASTMEVNSKIDTQKDKPEAVKASSMNGRTSSTDCVNRSPLAVKAKSDSMPGKFSICTNVNVNGSAKDNAESEDGFASSEDEEESDGYSPSEDDNYTEMDEEKINEASKHIFSCTYCEFAAIDLMELRSHYNENHPNDILTCQPCNQYFLSLKAYKIHCSGRGHQLKLREQSGETKMHKCKICDKRFLQESCCLLHMETVHRHPSCETDLLRIHKGQDLVTQLYGDHVKQVESLSNDTSVSCPECGKFVRKDTLVEHLRLHTGERPYACRFCSKGFAGRLTLRRHISSHLNMPLFMCDLCGKEFKRNSHLIKHIRQHDFERKGEKHTCHVCKAWFYTPEELVRHMRRHGDRNYKCTWPGCHWTFVLSGELKSHMFTHTGEKKYLCDMCGFGAPTKTRLRRHVKTHNKARNFTCDYCPYKATCKTHLKRHMRIHINAKPFACPYCNYTCNTHENIRKHILKTQKHKGMKLYPCRLCGAFGCDSSKEFRAHLMTAHASYLRENAIDSLAVFSGLYRREEDFQKPQEGSEILQVTKGRFFRSYQNPNAPIEPPKPKKIKRVNKMEEVKVNIVPPSELQSEEEVTDHHHHVAKHEQFHHQVVQLQEAKHVSVQPLYLHQGIPQRQQQQEEEAKHVSVQPLYLHRGIPQGQQQEEEESLVAVENETPHYIEVPNMVIHSYDPQQVQQLAGTTVSFTSSVLQHQHHHQQQQQPQPLPVTVTVSDDKIYWTLVPEQRAETVAVPVAAAEPWYSGMPQVHAPTSQDLQQYRPIEVAASSHAGQFLTSSYFSNIPVGDIQNIPNAVAAPMYASVVENVVLFSDPTRQDVTSSL